MAREVPQELLDEIVGRRPDIAEDVMAIREGTLERVLHRRAQRLLNLYGDKDGDEPKTTDAWKVRVGEESVKLNFLENPGCTLRAELLPIHFGNEDERGILDIAINETGSKWGEELITPGQLRTAMGLTTYLESLGFSRPLSAYEKERSRQLWALGSRVWYELDKRRVGP